MKVQSAAHFEGRRGIAAIISNVIMLVLVFSIGAGFLAYVTQGNFSIVQGQQGRAQSEYSMALEQLTIKTTLSPPPGNLVVNVKNTGSTTSTITDVYVINMTQTPTAIVSKSQSGGSPYLTKSIDLGLTLPVTLPIGSSASLTIPKASFQCPSGHTDGCPPLAVTVLTLQGNVFSSQFPPPPGATTTSTVATQTSVSSSTVTTGNPGGSVLVVQMQATPPQTLACSHCVNDTITVYNYGTSQVTNVVLFPSNPIISSTNTSPVGNSALVSITGYGCQQISGTPGTIPAWSGSGPAPSIVFKCNYKASLTGFGGFVSFTGAAQGTYNGFQVTSGEDISNTIQVGGPVSPLNQGPFSANFFYFKYSSCQNNPTGSSHCTTTPTYPIQVSQLPGATPISGNNYYVAFYAAITNNFNTSLSILPYSFMFVDPEVGSDSSWFIAGTPTQTGCPSACSWVTYVPNYNPGTNPDTPQVAAYPSSCTAQATSTCLYLNPGQTAVLTFAACDIGSTWWNWGGHTYGSRHDSGNTCTTNAPSFSTNGSTYVAIIISFVYKNQVYTQDIPFVGEYVQ